MLTIDSYDLETISETNDTHGRKSSLYAVKIRDSIFRATYGTSESEERPEKTLLRINSGLPPPSIALITGSLTSIFKIHFRRLQY